jgi:anti-sigma regulatory factor (Ser/Thr protein kinase)
VRRRLLGTEPARLIDRTALELKGAGGIFSDAKIAQQIVATESEDTVLTERTSSGGRMWVVRGNPIETVRGRGVCVIATDVTDLTAMEERCAGPRRCPASVRSSPASPTSAQSAVRDLRRRRALDSALEGPELREYAAGLRQEVRRMTELMSDLLIRSPGGAGPRRASLESVVRASTSAVRTIAQQQQVSIQITAASDLHAADIDRSRVQQVFENLLKNAISFSPRGSVVEIRCRNVDAAGSRWIECSITDRGPGIAEADLPDVFEPFFTRRRGGTGLGLAIVDRIVSEHRGQVSLANKDGGGAVATVRLPAAAPAETVDGA